MARCEHCSVGINCISAIQILAYLGGTSDLLELGALDVACGFSSVGGHATFVRYRVAHKSRLGASFEGVRDI